MKKNISNGVYLVVDAGMSPVKVLKQLEAVKNESIAAVQIWNNPQLKEVDRTFLAEIVQLYADVSTPILIHEQWELLSEIGFDGVHFDRIPGNFKEIERQVSKPFLKGVTLTNDLETVQKAEEYRFDYLSFCSMFASKTAISCEIVHPETVRKCRKMTEMPIFLSGGIYPENMNLLKDLSYQGVAVVSGVMGANDPVQAVRSYNKQLNK